MSNQDDFLSNEELPPPYSPRAGLSANYPSSQGSAVHSSQSSLFSSHLASLRSQIAAEQAARSSARDERDCYVLSLLVPYVEDLLLSIAGIHPPPTLVEATLIPDGAVSKEWQFSDENDKRRGEVRKLIRVVEESKMASDRKLPHANKGLDNSDWQADDIDRPGSRSGPTLWWEDEAMTRRLARHLQPNRSAGLNGRRPVNVNLRDEMLQARESKKASRWSLFKRDEPTEKSRPQAQPIVAASSSSAAQQSGNDVTMAVKAEEVTFRKENDFGIWETKTGWGLVIRVRIQNI